MCRTGEASTLVDYKKIALGLVGLFAVYSIISSPSQAADVVQVVFEWISELAKGIGDVMSDLLDDASSSE
ncbi:hypothetical protein ACXZ65_19320 [Streptomyces aculeolatus]|uniref:hypothetical protein n=1 Tax=Streptomyces aculeolatus TaxID=270689 RepID=UPI0003A23C01